MLAMHLSCFNGMSESTSGKKASCQLTLFLCLCSLPDAKGCGTCTCCLPSGLVSPSLLYK